jgi:glycosyltransferase involved in cell wall biosynthesis
MRECRALIFPSIWYEGLPFTILEAFATGTPVFASAIGSLPELIRDGYNGLHFPPGNADGLMAAIKKFEARPEEYRPVYEHARETWMDDYHPDRHYSGLIGIYESVIHQIVKNHA